MRAAMQVGEGALSLEDRQAITEVTIRYCWALDERDWEGLGEVFTPDATADLASARLSGLDAIAARCSAALSPLDVSQHLVSTHQVHVNGDTATHRCYLHAQHTKRGTEGGDNYIVAGRYLDDLIRTDDGWRITHRILEVDWTEGNQEVTRP